MLSIVGFLKKKGSVIHKFQMKYCKYLLDSYFKWQIFCNLCKVGRNHNSLSNVMLWGSIFNYCLVGNICCKDSIKILNTKKRI